MSAMLAKAIAMSTRFRIPGRASLPVLLALAAPAALFPASFEARGHAAELLVEERSAVAVTARYDTGTPMAEAQIVVFSPDSPVDPWLHGMTDGDGRFVFVPGDQAGRWSVRVRQAGHGAIVHLDLAGHAANLPAAPTVVATAAGGPTQAQKLIMAASLVWGCIGTALYFRRRGT